MRRASTDWERSWGLSGLSMANRALEMADGEPRRLLAGVGLGQEVSACQMAFTTTISVHTAIGTGNNVPLNHEYCMSAIRLTRFPVPSTPW